MEWTTPKGCTNQLLQGDGFYISYNARPGAIFGSGIFAGDDGSDETALCIEKDTKDGGTRFLILNGDFRKEYGELFPQGLAACRAFYEAHKETRDSSWTTSATA